MKNLIVDFESYYDEKTSVKTMGLPNYARAADAYIVSVIGDDFEFCGRIQELPALLGDSWMRDPDIQFWAFNANFDQKFWGKYYPAAAHPWKCISDLCAFHQLPRDLSNSCRVVLKKALDKSVRDDMKGKVFEAQDDTQQQRVIDYCLNDGVEEKRLLQALPPMSPLEDRLAAHTRLLNRRGVHLNAEKVNRDREQLEILRHTAMHSLPWVAEGGKPLSYDRFSEWCKRFKINPPVSLDKRDLACQKWIDDNPQHCFALKNMRLFRGVNTKLEKLKLMSAMVDESGRLPLELLYNGARHTRRWSAKTINVQNLDSKRVFVEEMKDLPFFKAHPEETPGVDMREYLIPPPGQKFGIIDYSQIEPRCLAWIVRNEPMLEAIRLGYGIYEAHAKASMRWLGRPGTLKHDDPGKYKYAKERVLSLGYGMGWKEFKKRVKINLGLDITEIEAQQGVNDFRQTNRLITRKWREMQRLIQEAGLHDPHTLAIEMPTGDLLQHFHVKYNGKGYESFTIKGDFTQPSHVYNLFGGLLVENVTQRMARDILGHALLNLEDAGIPVVFHAHDEVIIALDESDAKEGFEEAKQIMSIPPDWCTDLPLGVDGAITDHYVKLL